MCWFASIGSIFFLMYHRRSVHICNIPIVFNISNCLTIQCSPYVFSDEIGWHCSPPSCIEASDWKCFTRVAMWRGIHAVYDSACAYCSMCISSGNFYWLQCLFVLSQDCLPRSLFVACNSRPKRWLNIVLDINGILCEIEHSPVWSRGSVRQASYCCKFPTFIGPKAVYTRPGVRAFLADIRNITNSIVVWSSMKKSTVAEIAKYLFSDMPSPALILGQESCEKIEVRPNVFLMVQNNSAKMIFLKTLSSSLFRRRVGSMVLDSDNTLLIDDSPEKSVCNHTGNAIFLRPWRRAACIDKFLTGGTCTLAALFGFRMPCWAITWLC